MRVLLDTHIAIWAVTDDPRLPLAAKKLIADAANEIHVSSICILEIALKRHVRRKNKRSIPFTAAVALATFGTAGYRMLDVTPDHAAAVEDLPDHHGDPFDRLLVAQALTEPMRLLTHDEKLGAYGGFVLQV